MSDSALVDLARTRDECAQEELVARYSGDALRISKRSNLTRDERASVFGEVLMQCIDRFKPDRGEFANYLRVSLRRAIGREAQRARRVPTLDPGVIDQTLWRNRGAQLLAGGFGADPHEEGLDGYIASVAERTIAHLRRRRFRRNGTARLRADVAEDFFVLNKPDDQIRQDRGLSKDRLQHLIAQFLTDVRAMHQKITEQGKNL